MRKNALPILMVVFLNLSTAFTSAQNLRFQEVVSFSIPNISTISDFCFDDVDHDGMFEILVLCKDTLVLYSITQDAVLFSATLDSADYHKIALGDINRDSVVDIAVAHVYPISGWAWDGVIDSAYAIELFDGAAAYASVSRVYFPNFPGGWFHEYNLWVGMATFTAMDVNSDGYDNLFLSHGNYFQDRNPNPHIWSSDYPSRTQIFHSFPDSLLYASYPLILNPTIAYAPSGNFLTGQYLYRQDGGDYNGDHYITRMSFVLYNYDATDSYNLVADTPITCPGTYEIKRYYKSLTPVCIGDIDLTLPGLEVAAVFKFSLSCEYPLYHYTSGAVMQMYHRYSPDSVSLVWQRELTRNYSNLFYHPDFAGSLFGYQDGHLYRLDGRTGQEMTGSDPLPGGSFYWRYPYGDSMPYVVTIEDACVTVYDITDMTPVNDNDIPAPQPRFLSLGWPYPNPFNASQTIPIRIKPNSHLTVTVYDLLGRSVARLYCGTAYGGEMKLTWQADNLPSGIYFIRASTDQETASVRSILLK